MGFAFRRKESVRASLRRLSCHGFERALKKCGEDELESVHSTRKEIKKLRALARLVRKSITKQEFQRINGGLREAAGYLAGVRDAQVKLRALDHLLGSSNRSGPKAAFPAFRHFLAERCRRAALRYSQSEARDGVKKTLSKEARKFKRLELSRGGWTVIADGLKTAYCAGQKEFGRSQSESIAERFHQWRKRVKDLGYVLQLLNPIWPEQMSALSVEFERLGEVLGEDHDLQILRQTVVRNARRSGLQPEAEFLLALIDTRQKELRAESLRLGRRLYREDAGNFCDRLHQFWKVWRIKGSKRKRRDVLS